MLSLEELDSVIMERTKGCSRNDTLEFLIKAFNRALQLQAPIKDEKIISKIQEMKRVTATYAGLVLQNNFPENAVASKEASKGLILIPYLEGRDREFINVSFLSLICDQLGEESEIEEVFKFLFTFLFGKLSMTTLVSNFMPPTRAIQLLVSVPALAKVFVNLPSFIPTTENGYSFEQSSIVSSVFRFTPMLDTAGQFYFNNPQRLTRTDVDSSWNSIRLQLQPYHDLLGDFSRNLLKAGTREKYLDWFASLLERNRTRTRLHFDRSAVSSDGLMSNVGIVLVSLCEPFTSVSDKWKSIDPLYVIQNSRLSFANDTKLGASEEDVRIFLEKGDNENQNQYALHEGIITTGNYYIELNQTLGRILERKKQIQLMPRSPYIEAALHQLDQQADALLIMQLAIDSVLANPLTVRSITRFYSFSAEFLLRLLDPDLSGNLAEEPPMQFKVIPEFVIEDIMAYVMWMIRVHPDLVTDTESLEKFVRFSIHLISSPNYIRNPYLRSKLAGFLAEFVPKEDNRSDLSKTNLFLVIATHPLAHSHLVPGLISLYIDIEVTGRNSQFYDKLFVRREIALLLKHLRKYNEFIISLKRASKNTNQFVKFMHMLLGDAHYLVDEILIKLKDIKATIEEMQDQATWNQMEEDLRREREQTHAHTENQVKTFCTLANETIDLLAFFTGQVKTPFLEDMPERLANMVNYFLAQLCGPKCLELKVKNPAKYQWDPRALLTQLIRIYLNLAHTPEFVAAVGSDQRSFSQNLFSKAAAILRREMMIKEEEIKIFEELAIAAQEQADKIKLQDQEMMNAPDEFIDPILGTVMEDPVNLPVSGMTVDRATILRHLMSVPTDPFSRTPLSEDIELKAKIEEWKLSKK